MKKLPVLAILATIFWGSAFPSVKLAYEYFSITPSDTATLLLFAGCRFTLAGILTLLIYAVQNRRFPCPKREHIPGLFLLAFVMTFMQYSCYHIGMARTSGIKGAILNSAGTFAAVIFAHFFCKNDALSFRKAIGCLVGFAGVIVIHIGGSLGGFSLMGEGMMLMAAVCFGVASVLSKYIAPGESPFLVTGMHLSIGGLGLIICGLAQGGRLETEYPAAYLLLLYMSVLSAVAFSIWTYLLQRHTATHVTVYSLLIPVFGTILSAIFLRESFLRLQNIMALLLVCSGIAIVNCQKKID